MRRKRFQFSVASLLSTLTVFGVLFAITAINRWLAIWLLAAGAYVLVAFRISSALNRVHLGSVGRAAFGIIALSVCFNLATSSGGGIQGYDRLVFYLGCAFGTFIGLGFVFSSLLALKDDFTYWRERFGQGHGDRAFRILRLFFLLLCAMPLIAVGTLVVIFFMDGAAIRTVIPPPDVVTLTDFSQQMSAPQHLTVVERSDANYIVWIGQRPDTILPQSGPPCYVFDKSGSLIDYSIDTGDDHHVADYYNAAWGKPSITIREAQKVTNESE